jgi:hypothetical protein
MRNGEKILSLIGEKNDHTIRPRHNPAYDGGRDMSTGTGA